MYILAVLLIVSLFAFSMRASYAAQLSSVKDTLANQTQGETSNHAITFTTSNDVTATQTIKIQFDPAGDAFNLGTLALADMSATGLTPVAGCGGGSDEVTVAVDASAPDENVIFTVCAGDTVTAGAKTVNFNNTKITNPSSAGTYTISIGGSMTDSGSLAVAIVANDTVTVAAIVDPSLTFAISDTSIFFGALRSGGACFAQGTDPGDVTCPTQAETEAHTLTASTNAQGGYVITITNSGAATTLTSGLNTITAIGAANSASNPSNEQFGIRFNASGGSGAVTAPYAAAGYALDTAAFPDQIASVGGSSATTTYSARYLANISPVTEAGSYAVALNYVATATF